MKLRSLLIEEKRAVGFSKMKKGLRFRRIRSAIPLMLFGVQRSGTSMLMNVLDLHTNTQVFTEDAQSDIYDDYRLRGKEVISKAILDARAPVVCFKPISDSHIARTYIERFPEGRYVWVMRHYLDVAASSVKKWPEHGSRAIRIVCRGGVGGGWFQEGVSAETEEILRSIDQDHLTEFDYACLVWWARNRCFFEQELGIFNNVALVFYERLLDGDLKRLFDFAGLSFDERYGRYIRVSAARSRYPVVSPVVAELCEGLQDKFVQLSLEAKW